jgi:hypothetical protein
MGSGAQGLVVQPAPLKQLKKGRAFEKKYWIKSIEYSREIRHMQVG